MKAKSRLKSKRDNETPEKCLSDDSQGNLIDNDSNKSNDLYSELKITEDALQEFNKNLTPVSNIHLNTINIAVRHQISPENLKPPTKRVCILKKAPSTSPALPISSLMEKNNLRFDSQQRPVHHSILGTVEEYFKMILKKEKINLNDVPQEYQNVLEAGSSRRPLSAMFLQSINQQQEKENIYSRTSKYDRKCTDPGSNALKLWETRMNERKSLQNHIAKKIDRVPENLIFNSGEGFREKMERQHLISKGIPFYNYGYGFRTGSEFWQQRQVVGVDEDSCIHMTNTLTEQGKNPHILQIGVTNKIKEEKGVPILKPSGDKRGDYYEKRRNELNDVINELNPYQTDFDNLLVVGNSLNNQIFEKSSLSDGQRTSRAESLESQYITRSGSAQEKEESSLITIGPCLLINSVKLEIKNLEQSLESKTEIRLLFNGYAKDKCTEKLIFQNTGTSIIRYWWKKLDFYDPFNLENKNMRRFYFKNKDGILLPNQDLELPIIFKSEKSGIFSEMWKIETLPILNGGKDIIISMNGVALHRDLLAETRNNIDSYIRYQVAESICRNILDDIIQNIDWKGSLFERDYSQISDEKEIFNSLNKGIMYDFDNVQPLKILNEDLGSKNELELYKDWNMDCGILRKNILYSTTITCEEKEEKCQEFFKQMDKAMIPDTKTLTRHQDELYQIGYRNMLHFVNEMTDILTEMRKSHALPDFEIRFANDKRRNTLSRERTTNSQLSKKQPSDVTTKSKSKEPSNVTKKSKENVIPDSNETKRKTSQNISEPDQEPSYANEMVVSLQNEANNKKYRSKSYQIVYSLLDKTLTNIVGCWNDISFNE